MECTRALELAQKPEKLDMLEQHEQYAVLMHIRRCQPCKESLTAPQFIGLHETVVMARD